MRLQHFIIMFLLIFPCFAQAEEMNKHVNLEYTLDVSFDLPNSKVMGQALINVHKDRKLVFSTGGLRIRNVTLNQRDMNHNIEDGTLKIQPHEDGTLTIDYEGLFIDEGPPTERNAGVVPSVIDERGISLTGIWYPRPDRLATYHLRATLPRGYEALSEAEKIEKRETNGGLEFTFEFLHPVSGISLAATDRYEVIHDRTMGIDLYAYFFKEDRELARTYMGHAKKYLERYREMLTPYPYKRFTIAENFLASGYSMPTYTLLGQSMVRLPFIVETSLGHEILHQWFGNYVYIDLEQGNWAEGLTTYLSDHLYEEDKGKAWEYRKEILNEYDSYVNPENEFPLKEFKGRADPASRAIGYGKAAMIFHMLKRTAGEETFMASLRDLINQYPYQKASWQDIMALFEKQQGEVPEGFFSQWVDEKGLASLSLENTSVRWKRNKFEITFDLMQQGNVYTLDVPVKIILSGGGSTEEIVRIDKEKNPITLSSQQEPRILVVDQNYDLARRLAVEESPPVLSKLLAEEKPLIVLPVTQEEIYTPIIDAFNESGEIETMNASDLKDGEVRSRSLLLLGNNNPVLMRLYGKTDNLSGGLALEVRKSPWDPDLAIGIVHAESREEAVAAARKIFHYGKYSRLSFDKGRNRLKKIDETERGIREVLRQEEVSAMDLSSLKTLSQIIEDGADKKIIYVGEKHDNFAHHRVQLKVIERIFSKNPKVAIGMEMFQRPFQETLDAYVAGTIEEREFLKSSEYFDRWRFDYNLYKPILDFARANRIPVAALNTRREITKKVSGNGLDALSDEEKQEIPQGMDFSDTDYRDMLRDAFMVHKNTDDKNFDFFYQAQVLWDETMAQSIDEFMKNNPDYQMVVIAGGGHLIYGWGIPKRVFRRNGYDYAVILNDMDMEEGIADYLVFPEPLESISAPKLMVLLEEKDGSVNIVGFPKESVSKKAGLKTGDTIIAMDGENIEKVADVKLELYYKEKDDTVSVKVRRKRLLLEDKELEVEVKL